MVKVLSDMEAWPWWKRAVALAFGVSRRRVGCCDEFGIIKAGVVWVSLGLLPRVRFSRHMGSRFRPGIVFW